VLTADKLAGLVMSHRRVGLLASSAVVKLKHYEKLLKARGLTTVIPSDQAQLMAIIRAVKTGDTGASQRQQFLRIAEALMARQCDVLLVACTELSLFTSDLGEDMPVVDSLDVLVREVTAFVRQFPNSMQPKFAVGQS
jgi:aspartate racemase